MQSVGHFVVYKASLFSCLGFLSNRSHQSVESDPLSFDTQNVFFRHSTNTWSLRHHSVERAWNWEAGQDTLSYSYLYMLSWTIHPFRLVITHDLLKDSPIDDVSIKNLLLFHHIKQIVFILMPSVCSVIDKSSPNMVRTPVAHLAELHVPLFCSHHILTPSVIWTDVYFLFTPNLVSYIPSPYDKGQSSHENKSHISIPTSTLVDSWHLIVLEYFKYKFCFHFKMMFHLRKDLSVLFEHWEITSTKGKYIDKQWNDCESDKSTIEFLGRYHS